MQITNAKLKKKKREHKIGVFSMGVIIQLNVSFSKGVYVPLKNKNVHLIPNRAKWLFLWCGWGRLERCCSEWVLHGVSGGSSPPVLWGASLGWVTPEWHRPEPWAPLAWFGAHSFRVPSSDAPCQPKAGGTGCTKSAGFFLLLFLFLSTSAWKNPSAADTAPIWPCVCLRNTGPSLCSALGHRWSVPPREEENLRRRPVRGFSSTVSCPFHLPCLWK